MKHLLVAINAKYIHTALAVRSVYYYCKKRGSFDIDFCEYTINQHEDDILKSLYNKNADCYYFSCYIWNITFVKSIIPELIKLKPSAKIFLAGPEVTYKTKEFISEFPFISGIIVGEGEHTALQLFTALDNRQEISSINGLYTGQKNFSAAPPISLDDLEFNYPDIKDLNNRILYYESIRGCPFSCSYCLSSVERGVRDRSLNLVFKDLARFIEHKPKQVKFVDRTFNYSDSRAQKIWQFLIDNDNGHTNFHFELSANLLSQDSLKLLATARFGLFQFEVGVQSVNEQTLKEIERNSSLDKLKNNVNLLSQPGNIHLHLDLIAGLPYEDYSSFINSFNWVYALKPEQFQLGFLKVLGGSLMQQKASDYGLIYHNNAPFQILANRWISYDELCVLEGVEHMVDHYYNSGRYSYTVGYLINRYFPNPFEFFLKLSGEYTRFKGEGPLSKIAYYELLGKFCDAFGIEKDEYLKSLCILDIMLHEKPSRYPDWVARQTNNAENHDRVREFYCSPEKINRYLQNYKDESLKQLMRITHIEILKINPLTMEPQETAILANYNVREVSGRASFTIVDI